MSWRATPASDESSGRGFWRIVLVFCLGVILFQLGSHIVNYKDAIGPDPDDSMRLVEVRDFLNGQGWFDLTQYRLGPDGGTLMHWSRLIDLPIAGLIALFSLFLSQPSAEAAAALVWPLFLVLPLMACVALAGFRLGGRSAMIITLGLTAVYLAAIVRFRPGALDHHNVQIVLAMFIAAMLIDPLARLSNFAAAGIGCAIALAIGVETTPLVAVTGVAVSVLWAVLGQRYRRAATGFGLSLGLASGLIFVGTTPPRLWSSVTCDTLSIGYVSIGAIGGLGLAACAAFLTRRDILVRFVALGALGGAVLGVVFVVAPQCLGNPLDDLDPLLKTMWLGSISEAQSIMSEMTVNPSTFGGFYAVGLIGIAVAAARIVKGQLVVAYSLLAALIGVSWLVAAYQVRGTVFANFLAFLPLGALVADLRRIYLAQRNDSRAALAFVFATLASIPSVWVVVGVLAVDAGDAIAGIDGQQKDETEETVCVTPQSVETLAQQPVGRILSTSNPGSLLLRYTPHSVLTANYHRNQQGMLEALRMSMAPLDDARTMLYAAKIKYILLCGDDPQIGGFRHKAPRGLFSRLAGGDVPEFLEPIRHEGAPQLKIFKVL